MPAEAAHRMLKPRALYTEAMLQLVKRAWSPISQEHVSIRTQLEQVVSTVGDFGSSCCSAPKCGSVLTSNVEGLRLA